MYKLPYRRSVQDTESGPRDDVLSSWTIHVRCTRDLDKNQGVVWIDYSLAWTNCRRASLAENGLSLGIQSLPLRGLSTDCAEALDAQRLARLFASITPLLQGASGPVLLRSRGRSLAHDLSGLALDQGRLGQTTNCLHLPATEDCSLGRPSPRDDADLLHLLHGLLHGGFLCLHALHRCLHGRLAGRLHRESHGDSERRSEEVGDSA